MNFLATIFIVSLFCGCAHGVGEPCRPYFSGKSSCTGSDKCCSTDSICRQNCTATACTAWFHCNERDGEICCRRQFCAKPEVCECTINYHCGDGRSCCGTCKLGRSSCVGFPCFNGSDCQRSGEICCDGYCRRSSDCTCSKNSQCGDGSACCSSRCKLSGTRGGCAGHSCSSISDCQPDESCCDGYCKSGPNCTCSYADRHECGFDRTCCGGRCWHRPRYTLCAGAPCANKSDCRTSYAHCCDGICSDVSCSSMRLTESRTASKVAAIVMSVLVVVAVAVTFLVAGLRYSVGPCKRKRQPEAAPAMAATSDVAEMRGPATPQPTFHPPGQEPPPGYTPVAQGEQPEHAADAHKANSTTCSKSVNVNT